MLNRAIFANIDTHSMAKALLFIMNKNLDVPNKKVFSIFSEVKHPLSVRDPVFQLQT